MTNDTRAVERLAALIAEANVPSKHLAHWLTERGVRLAEGEGQAGMAEQAGTGSGIAPDASPAAPASCSPACPVREAAEQLTGTWHAGDVHMAFGDRMAEAVDKLDVALAARCGPTALPQEPSDDALAEAQRAYNAEITAIFDEHREVTRDDQGTAMRCAIHAYLAAERRIAPTEGM